MKCTCGKRIEIVDSRPTEEGEVRRCRSCASCGKRFFTREVEEKEYLRLVNKEGLGQQIVNNLMTLVNKLNEIIETSGKGS